MCQAKPGLRCSTHARQRLNAALAAERARPTVYSTAKVEEARFEYLLTPEGRETITDADEKAKMFRVAVARKQSAQMIAEAMHNDLSEESQQHAKTRVTATLYSFYPDRAQKRGKHAIESLRNLAEGSREASIVNARMAEDLRSAAINLCNETGEPVSADLVAKIAEIENLARIHGSLASEGGLISTLMNKASYQSLPDYLPPQRLKTPEDDEVSTSYVGERFRGERLKANYSIVLADTSENPAPNVSLDNSVVLGHPSLANVEIEGSLVVERSSIYDSQIFSSQIRDTSYVSGSTVRRSKIGGDARIFENSEVVDSEVDDKVEVYLSEIYSSSVKGRVEVDGARIETSSIQGKGSINGSLRNTYVNMREDDDVIPEDASLWNGMIESSSDFRVLDSQNGLTAFRNKWNGLSYAKRGADDQVVTVEEDEARRAVGKKTWDEVMRMPEDNRWGPETPFKQVD